MNEDDRRHLDGRLADLLAVGGEAGFTRLVTSFTAQLEALERSGETSALAHEAHRLAGLSGLIGLRRLEMACRALETHPADAGAAEGLRTAMTEAIIAMRSA